MKKKADISTWHLHLTGQVQGIGFRPTVYGIAKRFGIVGHVQNEADGLHVIFNASKQLAKQVKTEICQKSLPRLARITAVRFKEIAHREFNAFSIIHGAKVATPNLILTPDIAVCDACSQELTGRDDRRDSYLFNSCSQCGPRYSIIEKLPYDRVHTKMAPFDLCKECLGEYENPLDRRYYAQTISCANCAIQLTLHRSNGELVTSTNSEIIQQVSNFWEDGKIIAIKGIGGYLLTCHAENEQAIQRLRDRKFRPTKPLAVMYPSMQELEDYKLSLEVMNLLCGNVSPIVLVSKTEQATVATGICDSQDHIGVMLPNAPIFKVLLNKFQRPIIATSGNRSNSPITYTDENAFEQLSEIADFILTNSRDILVPQDDSVIKFSEVHHQKVVLRRSRGLAPTYINSDKGLSTAPLLATGAQLKSTFCLHKSPNTYISQYLGDLESFESFVNYRHCLEHLTGLLKIKPTVILSDRHKGYASTDYGQNLAKKWDVPIQFVPHHKAHFSAILGEHNLIEEKEPILGVIWDGAGLGDDDAIWGSEFFIYHDFEFTRCSHLDYFDLLLGDKMAKEPRLSALSLAFDSANSNERLQEKFTAIEWSIYKQVVKKEDHIQTSSMGRLFDAVASILGLIDKQTYVGEAPMLLEVLATSFFRTKGFSAVKKHYFSNIIFDHNFSAGKLIELVFDDIRKGLEKSLIAAKFHLTLIKWIEHVADQKSCDKIAFSGGVFQNGLLIDLAIECLSKNHELYFHKELSCNDENISFGQLIYHRINNKLI